MNSSDIAALEASIKQNQQIIAYGDALSRLENNKDFKKIFLEGYFREEAIRLVGLLGDPYLGTPEKQASIIKQMEGISNLRSYLILLAQNAMKAKHVLSEEEEALEEILNSDEAGE